MMTSSNGNIFHVTGPLCGEFTGPGEFPLQRPVTRSFDVAFDLRLNKRLNNWVSARQNFNIWSRKYHKNPSDINKYHMLEARKQFKTSSWKCRRNYDKLRTRELLEARVSNAKAYWKLLKGDNRKEPNYLNADVFENFFRKIGNPEDEFFHADQDILDYVNDRVNDELQGIFDMLNIPIGANEISQAITQLKSGKSGGEDLLINELFTHGREVLLPYVTSLFNYIFRSGVFPEPWTEGLLVPLHKKGSLFSPDNYRGITLLSVLGKLFTRVINNRLENWAEEYGIYIEAQNGFRKGRGTVDSIYILNEIISSFISSGKKLYAFFIDFSKAFDYVVRDNLWYKLLQYGIGGNILKIIMSMYKCVKTKVYVNGQTSASFEYKLGVRQGECLSPFLFAMYVNDMEEALSQGNTGVTVDDVKLFLLFYADDAVIFAESAEELQNGINILFRYCNRWKMKLNTDKSQIIVFKKGRKSSKEKWSYGDMELKVTSNIDYLGLRFSSTGSFHQAQQKLASQANKAAFILHKRLNNYPYLTPKHAMEMFDKMITPILCYASEVWGFHDAPDIERVQLKFCKTVLGVKSSVQNDFVYGELDRMPMKCVRFVNIVRYWLKIVHGEKSRYVTKCYMNALRTVETNDEKSWVNSLKAVLEQNGFGDVWLQQGVGDRDIFLKVFKQRLLDIFRQNWGERLSMSSRAVFYRSVKENWEFSEYLETVHVTEHRKALCRLIVSSHQLRIETGRWERPSVSREMRHCELCNNGIEDEFHFLLECPVYSSIRKQLINRYYWNRPSMYKLVQLFNSKRRKEIIALAKYVYQAFKLRRELIAVNWNVLICKVLFCVHWVFRNYYCAMLCLCAINISVKLAFVCRFCCLCTRLYGPVALKQLKKKNPESWVLKINNHEACDLRRHRAHYDVIVMIYKKKTVDVITHWRPNFTGGLVKPPFKLGHEWTYHTNNGRDYISLS